jgi:predicted ATPase/DNA-binding CsgD family transcriptional regulator
MRGKKGRKRANLDYQPSRWLNKSRGRDTSAAGFIADAIPNNLPVLRSAIVGRQEALAATRDLLLRDDVGLLTFTGPGGVGKTRLALQLATQLQGHFPHGVFFVNLAPIREPDLVVSTIVQALGMQENPGQSLLESLKSYLRDRELLLVLDNFEHILKAASTVAELLAASAHLKVLTTSREVLHLYEEHIFPVLPLSCPEPKRLPPLEQLTQYEAVSLFIQRARTVKPDFQVTSENAPAVAEICHRLNGLPLAIELAAAHIRLLAPQAILSRLERRLPLLIGGARDLPARQQTLRNTIEWSYDLLDDGEKDLFRRLAVFVGGCTLEAIEAVCHAERHPYPDVLAGVSSLVDKNLLRKEQGAGSEPRFVMLETIREYASEKLQEHGEAEELQMQHASYFATFAEEAEPRLKAAEQEQWLDRLEAAHDNFRAALAWSVDRQEVMTALCLAGHLGYFWFMRSHFREGLNWLSMAMGLADLREHAGGGEVVEQLTSADNGALRALQAKALWAAGLLTAWHGLESYALPRSYIEQSITLAREGADRPLLANALFLLGIVLNFEGDYAAASARIEESLGAAREAGYVWGIANALDRMGSAQIGQGEIALRRARREESLALRRQVGDRGGIAVSLLGLGEISREEGDYTGARHWYEQALPLFKEVGSPLNVGITLSNLGHVMHHLGDDVRAGQLFIEALVLARDQNNKVLTPVVLAGIAGPVAEMGGAAGEARAARLLGAATALLEATSGFLEPVDRADYDVNMAAIRARLGKQAFAAAWAEGHAMTMDGAIAYALEIMPELTKGSADASTPDHTLSIPTTSSAQPALHDLTKRELEVLRHVAEGLTTPEVAERLVLSVRTVENHLRSIYNKLDVSTRAAATRIAVEHGLLND